MERFIPPVGSVEYQDHTADLWIQSTGEDPEEVIARLIQGIYCVMATSFDITGSKEGMKIEARGPDLETAMVDLLNEILFLFDAETLILLENSIKISHEGSVVSISLEGKGRMVSVTEGEGGMEVKAVTYHGASVQRMGEKVTGKVLLDL